jgi:MoaA/NifB/PqqE/SkfB family radical SAM enzyme
MPHELHIEANASCQLRCPTCPTTSQGYPPVVGSGYLHFRDFRNLLDENSQVKKVQLQNRGEMFLNPELLQIIEYGFKKGIAISADSGVNLNFVREGVLEGLVKYRFRSLLCSIDGATPETYRIYRVGGSFERVIKYIQEINHYKKLYQSKYPKLSWQFVVFGHNEHEIPLAREMASSLNMSFVTKMSWDSKYSPVRNREFVMKETGWPAVTREEFEKIKKQDYMRGVCSSLWISPRDAAGIVGLNLEGMHSRMAIFLQ